MYGVCVCVCVSLTNYCTYYNERTSKLGGARKEGIRESLHVYIKCVRGHIL